MIVALLAGETPGGKQIERSVPVPEVPRASAIAETLRAVGEAVQASPEAAAYVDVVSQSERLESAIRFLQARSGEMHERSLRDFAAAIEKSIDDAASGRATPEKVLLSFDLADRVQRGFSILTRETAERSTRLRPSLLTAEADWLLRVCAELEHKLEEHQQAVAEAMRGVVELEGGADLGQPTGTYTSEIRRTITELSEKAVSLRKQARELQDPEAVAQERLAATLAGHKRVSDIFA